jgi:hypothetical protein
VDDFTGVFIPAQSSSVERSTASDVLPGVLTSHEMGTSLETDGFTGVLRGLRAVVRLNGEPPSEKWGLNVGEK